MVHYFRTHFDFTCHYIDGIIDEWVEFAISKKVEILELDFDTTDKNHDNMFNYDFAYNFDFTRLKKLYLNKVNMRESCQFVVSVYLFGFDLESFTYIGRPIDLRLTRLPKLKNVAMSQELVGLNNNAFHQIASCASSLQALSFKIDRPKQSAKLDSIPRLPNIKKLTLTIVARADNSLLEFASMVNACPNLETFIIECQFVVSVYLFGFDLESFTYIGRPIDLRLTRLPKLKNVAMSQELVGLNNNAFHQIASCASSLQALSFKIDRPKQSAKLDSIPRLPNIKKLTLTIVARADNSLLEFASMVNACPNLETFIIESLPNLETFIIEVLKLSPINDLLNRIITGGRVTMVSPIKRRRKATRIAADHRHAHLKLFQIRGYYGRISDLELAAYMIDNADALKKIVIDPCCQVQKGIKPVKDFSENERAARSYAKRQLQPILPQGVELVVL
ncbi:hypothetical protein L1987_42556 [Smallanthus sonchifolius]|uniref:Uncharacterized protein n=1 Tax=Smallanthus sonchifolius TaxID=185202 RepID=A0ACB9GIZ7_9ASTR|nr:hypothetical protein L1987_42556 [Smallanthus sonchifolius]